MTKYNTADPLHISRLMRAIDNKEYDYFDRLNEDEQKKISPYLLLRWLSTVKSNFDIAGYYTVATAENINNNFFNLYKHKKLQWLLCCTVSPNMGKQYHSWLGNLGKSEKSPVHTKLYDLMPTLRHDEIDVLVQQSTKEEIEEWLLHREPAQESVVSQKKSRKK